MNIRTLFLVSGMLASLLAGSCASEKTDTPKPDGRVKANFSAGISTRVSDVLWDTYDAIGITMLDRSTNGIENGMLNVRYSTTTAAGNFVPTSTVIYFPQDGSEVTFKAYYPYMSGLDANLEVPVSVADQTNLSGIDFMSAEHLSGFSKSTPEVSLRFYHRLSKVIFRLYNGDEQSSLEPGDFTVTINGMKTTGTYSLLNETLTVDDGSEAGIVIPTRGNAAERTGIVLPRAAGSGVTFDIDHPNGNIYSADMGGDLALEPGYKYVFNLTLIGNEISVSVTIEDWTEGPSTDFDILGVGTPAGDSTGVEPGDQMQVYIQDGVGYEDLATYTYGTDGRWSTSTPVYWDDIDASQSSINLRAALVPREPAKNATQMEDIIIADPLNVARNTGADFTLRHAGSRVVVTLQSTTFTDDEMEAATITLPSYLSGGSESMGEFIPGTVRQDIVVDRSDADDNFAIIQPQSVSPAAAQVRLNIKGKDFTGMAGANGFTYEAGTAYELVVTINENDISVSARVIDWTPSGPHAINILEVVTAGDTEGVEDGARMSVYRGTQGTYNLWTVFTYAGDNVWNPDSNVYWSDLQEDGADLRATIVAAPKLNTTQMDDYLVSEDVYVTAYTSADFVFRHVGSKATVKVISDVIDQTLIDYAIITMPGYRTGATLNANGEFVPGTSTSDVTLVRDDTSQAADGYNHVAIIQPQTVPANTDMFVVTIGNKDYYAKAPAAGFAYEPGVNYAIVISVNEDNVAVSAQVIGWTEQTINLNAFVADAVLPGASDGIEDGEQMEVYVGTGGPRTLLTTFTYTQLTDTWTASPTAYWENLTAGETFYAGILRQAKYNDTQLDDYLIATPVTPNFGDPVNFVLSHPAARVEIQLRSGDGTFSTEELEAMEMTLSNYMTGGAYDTGQFIFPGTTTSGDIEVAKVNGSALAIIRPQFIDPSQSVVDIYDPNTGKTYNVRNTVNTMFNAGQITILDIDMRKTEVRISATVEDWVTQTPVSLTPTPITIVGTEGPTDDFFKDKSIRVYKMGQDFKEITYSYTPETSGSTVYTWKPNETLYWEDLNGQTLNVTAAYNPGIYPTVTGSTTTYTASLPTDQSMGYDNYDVIMSNKSYSAPSYVNFAFKHIYSRVRVEIETVNNEFTADELVGIEVTLNNFVQTGSVSLLTASAQASSSPRVNVTPLADPSGMSFSALVMPQTIPANTNIVTVKLRNHDTPFTGRFTTAFSALAGMENVITVILRKTEIEISATLEEWGDGSSGEIVIQ